MDGGREYTLSVAPMMDRTDRHFRFIMRQITQRTLLYSEMITAQAVLRGPTERLLAFDPVEHPVALQLGGDNPEHLARAARIGERFGYDEVNLNVGCPSARVQEGRFGVCLMAEPDRVAAMISAMQDAVSIPVTVKHRIGFDDLDTYAHFLGFVECVARTGCSRFSVHARKAWLSGLSPKENRNIPSLRYDDVYRLKRARPDLSIEINGGVRTLDAAAQHLDVVDAVMVGRAAYDDPYMFAPADARFFGGKPCTATRFDVVHALLPYVERHVASGGRLWSVARHLFGLFAGQSGARAFRRHLSEHAHRPGAGPEVLAAAAALVRATGGSATPDRAVR